MARKTIAPATPAPAAAPLPDTLPLDRGQLSDVELALSEIRAGWWLLDAMSYGYLMVEDHGPVGQRSAGPRTDTECEDVRAWLEKWALARIEKALIEVGDVIGAPSTPKRRPAKAVA